MSYTMVMPTVLRVDENNESLAKMAYVLNNWVRMLVSYGKVDVARLTSDFNLLQSIIKCADTPKHIKRSLTSCRDRLLKNNAVIDDLVSYIKKVTSLICDELEDEDVANLKHSRTDKRMTKRYSNLVKKIKGIKLNGTSVRLCDTDIDTLDKQTARTVRRIVEKRAAQNVAHTSKNREECGNAFRQAVRRSTSFSLFASYREEVDNPYRDANSHWTIIVDKNTGAFIRKKKIGYNTSEEAEVACIEYMKAHPEDEIPMSAYQCPTCGKWHIGHDRFSIEEIA